MHIRAYLDRIGYAGAPAATLQTLMALHEAHLLAIPYENLDIHLGCPLTLDTAAMYDKMVPGRRGGWCYEMNGLFAWALGELGFEVTLLASAVNRAVHGDGAERNHLILRVDLKQAYLVDVGFGNGFRYPLPLKPGLYRQSWQEFELRQQGDRWHLLDHATGGPGYDFTLEPRQMADFAEQCQRQQTSPNSGFVRATVCHRFTAEGFVSLRGLVLRGFDQAGMREQTITGEADYHRTLRDTFGLDLPDGEMATLWQVAQEKHAAFLAQ
jgi:N-hydroxyarylamine O-acetyltransferase